MHWALEWFLLTFFLDTLSGSEHGGLDFFFLAFSCLWYGFELIWLFDTIFKMFIDFFAILHISQELKKEKIQGRYRNGLQPFLSPKPFSHGTVLIEYCSFIAPRVPIAIICSHSAGQVIQLKASSCCWRRRQVSVGQHINRKQKIWTQIVWDPRLHVASCVQSDLHGHHFGLMHGTSHCQRVFDISSQIFGNTIFDGQVRS